MLNTNGFILHYIDLEDHKNPINKPFEFLSIPQNHWNENLASNRGNRIRSSEWKKIFLESNNNIDFKFCPVNKRALPKNLSVVKEIKYRDEEDLKITGLIVIGKKIN